jgi:hypothetical protein
VDQQATRSPGIQSGATIDSSRLKGSQGVTPFLKVTAQDFQDKLDKEAFANERLRTYLGQGPTGVAPDGFFRDVLDKLDGRLFTPSRYPYEGGKSVHGLPLGVISDILRVFSSVVG